MHASRARPLLRLFSLPSLLALLALPAAISAQPIRVLFTQGQGRGFLVVRTAGGKVIGDGEYSQTAHEDRVTSHLTLHLSGGSVDDELTVYSQRGTYALISDRHIQRGPFFDDPSETILSANGDLIVKHTGKDGKEKVETSHLEMPADVSNGMLGTLLTNIPAESPEFRLGMVLPDGKGRLIQLRITPEARTSFRVAGRRRSLSVFRLHLELGGLTGVVAPMIGKQPPDAFVYVLEGDCPTVVREVGQLAQGGPLVSVELAGSTFAPFQAAAR